MSFIRIRSDITDSSDLSGLISGMILRQDEPFSEESIFRSIKRNLEGAVCKTNDDELKAIIEDRLDIYERNNVLELKRGIYYPQALECFL